MEHESIASNPVHGALPAVPNSYPSAPLASSMEPPPTHNSPVADMHPLYRHPASSCDSFISVPPQSTIKTIATSIGNVTTALGKLASRLASYAASQAFYHPTWETIKQTETLRHERLAGRVSKVPAIIRGERGSASMIHWYMEAHVLAESKCISGWTVFFREDRPVDGYNIPRQYEAVSVVKSGGNHIANSTIVRASRLEEAKFSWWLQRDVKLLTLPQDMDGATSGDRKSAWENVCRNGFQKLDIGEALECTLEINPSDIQEQLRAVTEETLKRGMQMVED